MHEHCSLLVTKFQRGAHVCGCLFVSAHVFLSEGERQVERYRQSSSPETFISHYLRGGVGKTRRSKNRKGKAR